MRAFCPGHITGFFTIEDSDADILRRGSRGVGFCVEAGATADVSFLNDGQTDIDIFVGGQKTEAAVTKLAIDMLLPEGVWHAKVELDLQAPVGYGCGMSAAGTFAACLALAEELGLLDARTCALQATHKAEVKMKTGLGDAVAQNVGGVVHRISSGTPPFGRIDQIDCPVEEVVICIIGDGMNTPDILGSETDRRIICDAGSVCLAEFEKQPDLNEFLRLSKKFAVETGLLTSQMQAALESVSGLGAGSMAMLGNSIFVFGNVDAVEERLRKFGTTIRTKISSEGANVLD